MVRIYVKSEKLIDILLIKSALLWANSASLTIAPTAVPLLTT